MLVALISDTHGPRRWKGCPPDVARNHEEGGQRSVNPGSPTDRRRQPHGTMGLMRLEAGAVASLHILPVSP